MNNDPKSCTTSSSCSVPVGKSTGQVRKHENPVLALQNEVNKLFGSFFGDTLPSLWHSSERMFASSPAIDVAETDKEIRITAEVTGMDAKDVQVTLSDKYVTISGNKSEEKKEEKKGYFHQERSYGEFQRVVALPENANGEKAEANISKGILVVTVPKKEGSQSKSRKLDIKQAA